MFNKENNERLMLKRRLEFMIHQYLEMCDEYNTPYLCRYIKDKEGYDEVVEFCVKMFILNQTSIGDALVQKENILNPNYLID